MKTFAQLAFEAFARDAGDPRAWDDLPEATKTGWRSAALAVLEKAILPPASSDQVKKRSAESDVVPHGDDLLLIGRAQYSVA